MLSTSGFALQYLSVPMVTVFKNFTVCFIAYGDQIFFKANHSKMVVFSLALMIFGSLLSAATDLSFNLYGYLWMAGHVFS
jgi:GDP-mannose transporter